jgi:hypothetical protein
MVRYPYDVGKVDQEYFRWIFGLGFGWICIKIYKKDIQKIYKKIYNCVISDAAV